MCQRPAQRAGRGVAVRVGVEFDVAEAVLECDCESASGLGPAAMIGEDSACNAEEPWSSLLALGEIADTAPRDKVDLCEKVGRIFRRVGSAQKVREDCFAVLVIRGLEAFPIGLARGLHFPAHGAGCPTQNAL